MTGIRGNWEANLTIDGKTIPFGTGPTGLFTTLAVRSNIHMTLPSLSLDVNDANGSLLDAVPLADGVKVVLELGDGKGGGMTYPMVMQGGPKDLVTGPQAATYSLRAVLDHTNWMRKIVDTPTRGNSQSVLASLAQQVGLQFLGDATNDAMMWLPNFLPIGQYARFVAERGWNSASSCMALAVTETSKLLYKDIDRVISGGASHSYSNQGGGVPYLQTSLDSKAAFYNNQRGYGSTTVVEQFDGTVKKLNAVVGTKMSNFLNIGKSIAEGLGELGGRIDVLPMNAGNTHPKYEEAQHQNRRIKNLLAQDMSVLTDFFSGIDLMKLATYVPNTGTGPNLTAYGGNYMLTGKVMTIENGRYYEKHILTSNGPSSSEGGGLF